MLRHNGARILATKVRPRYQKNDDGRWALKRLKVKAKRKALQAVFYTVPVVIVLNGYPFFCWGHNLKMNSCVLGDASFDVSSSQLGREMLAGTWVSLLSIFAIPKGGESKSVWRFLCGWFFVKGAVPLLLNGTANRRSFPVFF